MTILTFVRVNGVCENFRLGDAVPLQQAQLSQRGRVMLRSEYFAKSLEVVPPIFTYFHIPEAGSCPDAFPAGSCIFVEHRLHCYSSMGNDACVGGVCRYIYCATLNTQCTALPPNCRLPWWSVCFVAILQSGFDPKCSNFGFWFFYLLCFYNKIYFFSLFHCIMPLIQFNAFSNHG